MVPAGCQPTDSKPSAGSADGGQKPKVALIMKSLGNEFFATMAAGAEQHQAEHADEYELVVNGIKDETDLSRQVALVEEMVASGVDAIVIAPADSKALVPVLRKAKAAGVVVINIDNRLDQEVLAAEDVSIPFVGPDNKLGAKKVAQYLAQRLESGDAVAVVEGSRTSFNGTQRRLGFEEAMNEAGMRIVDSQSAQWEMSRANNLTSTVLSEHPEIKAILAANDSMAMGALAAIKSSGRCWRSLIIGFDNISAIQRGDQRGQSTGDRRPARGSIGGVMASSTPCSCLDDAHAVLEDLETPVDLVTAESLE